MTRYTVILMYPYSSWESDEKPETYTAYVEAVDYSRAVRSAQIQAVNANDYHFDHEDLIPLAIIEGHPTMIYF